MQGITISDQHVYRVDGRIVPGVTQIISDAGIDPNKNFYNKVAAQRGKDIHTITEQIDKGTLLNAFPKEWSGYISAYYMFLKFNRPVWNVDGVEQTFYNEDFDYCGTRDRVGTMLWRTRRVECCLDIKTGVKAKWHGVQLAGYSMKDRYKLERFGLYLKKNGTYSIHHYTNDGDFEDFINASKKGKRNGN
jgi:hypothetical protein